MSLRPRVQSTESREARLHQVLSVGHALVTAQAVGMMASRSDSGNKRARPDDEFDFESEDIHPIFTAKNEPNPSTVIANKWQKKDLVDSIDALQDAVIKLYDIGTMSSLTHGIKYIAPVRPDGEKITCRVRDMHNFNMMLFEESSNPSAAWSAFRKLLLGFVSMEGVKEKASSALSELDKLAEFSKFKVGADGGYEWKGA